MLVKEECEKALGRLIECKKRKLCCKCNFKNRCTLDKDKLVIKKLIKEHFELKDVNKKYKEFGEHMLNEDKCQIAFDTIAYGGADRDEYNKCCDIIQQLIEAYFDGINNLDEVIEIQKNNLTSPYMIGLHNGLVTAKNILLKNNGNYKLLDCVENIKPYKFEELHDFMGYHDNKLNKDCLISQIYGKSILIGWYDENDGINNKWVEFEENRFYPLTKA